MADLHIPEDVEKSFEELWQEHRFEIEHAEAQALYNPSMSDDTPIIKVIKSIFIFACPCLEQIELVQYHRASGTYPYLSENFPSPITYEGIEWPSAQHAYQAAKIARRCENRAQLMEQIRTEHNTRKLWTIGHNLPVDPAFADNAHKLSVMFAITYRKFQQNQNLVFRLLHDTGNKPIWHVCDDPFWGTRRPSTASHAIGDRSRTNRAIILTAAPSSGGAEAPPPARPWHSGDNWNGRILSVVRALVRAAANVDPAALLKGVEADFRDHCPCPEEYTPLPAAALHLGELPIGTVIAGRYSVDEVLASYAHTYVHQESKS